MPVFWFYSYVNKTHLGKTVSEFFGLGCGVGVFFLYRVCFRERQQSTKLLGKMKSKESLQAAGEDIREVFITPASWNIIKDLGLVWDKAHKVV